MRLALIITGLSTGGAEMMLLKLMERIDRSSFMPHVFSLTTLGEIGPRIQALGIPVEALGMRPGIPGPLAFFRLTRRLKGLQPEVVQTFMYHADLMGGLACRMAGIRPLVWGIRNSALALQKIKWSTRVVICLCAKASRWLPARIVSCSLQARDAHVALGYAAERFQVIPNGFDLDLFAPKEESRLSVREELGLAPGTPLVGLIARFDPQKNHNGFIEAASLLKAICPDVHFILAGNGVAAGNSGISHWVREAGLEDCVHLLGLRKDIPRLMSALDVAASSSWGESFPNVLGEAMACGVPCVVTDVGDSAYIVGDTGVVVRVGDMSGLASGLASILRMPINERHTMGERARARVAEHFEIGAVVRRYEALYENLYKEMLKQGVGSI